MAALGTLKRLAVATAVKLNEALITTTGTLDFAAPPHTNVGGDFSLLFQFVGTATTFTAALQISLDNGTTFTDYVLSANFFNAVAGSTVVKVTPAFSNVLFRMNVTTATGVSGSLYVSSN